MYGLSIGFHLQGIITLKECFNAPSVTESSTAPCLCIHHGNRKQRYTSAARTGFKVWLNGVLIYENLRYLASEDYTDFFPITLQPGRNVLLVAVHTHSNGFFGFETGTEYTLSTGIGYTFFQIPIHVGDTFTLDIRAERCLRLGRLAV